MSLPRYKEYKASASPWFETMPSHWEPTPLKRVVAFVESGVSVNAVDKPAGPESFGVLKTSCVYTGTFDPAENKAVLPEETGRVACPVKAGTLVVSRMNTPALVGAAGLVMESAENLFLPDRLWQVHFSNAEPKFVHYWTNTPSYRAQVQMACAGTSASMQNLSQDEFLRFTLPLPPRCEQTAIAAFLDRETRKIDTLIAEHEKLIVLLAEKREATVSHAVTRGINPNAPMKNSGIPWLGEVPAHWDVVPLMHLTHPARPIMYGIVLPGLNVDDGIPIVKGGDVKEHRLKLDLLNRTTADIEAPYARARLKPLDIVYSIRGTIGDAEVVPDELADANITQDVARISPAPGVQTRWLLHVMKAKPTFVQLEQRSLGAAVRGINIFELKRARIAVPPPSERNCIAEFLDVETEKIDMLNAEAERTIQLLKERRSALISAAVTGQIDVRGVVQLQGQFREVIAA